MDRTDDIAGISALLDQLVDAWDRVRQGDGRWKIAAFQNTMRKPLTEAISFRFKPASKPSLSRPIQDQRA